MDSFNTFLSSLKTFITDIGEDLKIILNRKFKGSGLVEVNATGSTKALKDSGDIEFRLTKIPSETIIGNPTSGDAYPISLQIGTGLNFHEGKLRADLLGEDILFVPGNGLNSIMYTGADNADGDYSIAFGWDVSSLGDQSIGIGYESTSSATYGVAIGRNTSAEGNESIAIGSYAQTSETSSGSISIGVSSSVAAGVSGMAIGDGAASSHNSSVAIGSKSSTFRDREISISQYKADTTNNSAHKFLAGVRDPQYIHDAANKKYVDSKISDVTYSAGTNVQISSNNVISATNTTYSSGSKTLLDTGTSTVNRVWKAKDLSDHMEGKYQEELTSGSNITISSSNIISATNTTYNSGTASQLNSGSSTIARVWSPKILHDYIDENGGQIIEGTGANSLMSRHATSALGGVQIVIGESAKGASGSTSNAIVIGTSAEAKSGGYGEIAIGPLAESNGQRTVALGPGASVIANNGISIGNSATSTKTHGIAIGSDSQVDGNYSIAIGPNSEVNHLDSVAIGRNSKTFRDNEVSFSSASSSGTNSAHSYLSGVKTPQYNYDAANKKYVDDKSGGAGQISDERLKSNIKEANIPLEKLLEIPTVNFIMDDKNDFGTTAQGVQKVIPEIVEENSEGYLTVNYGKLSIAALIGLKELNKDYMSLLERVEKIEESINNNK